MKTALILHAWYSKPNDNWYPWLKKQLEGKGYEVYIPDLPTMGTNLPDLKKQLDFVEKNFKLDKDTIILLANFFKNLNRLFLTYNLIHY